MNEPQTIQLPEGAKVTYADASLNPSDLATLLRAARYTNTVTVDGTMSVMANVRSIDGDVRLDLINSNISQSMTSLTAPMTIWPHGSTVPLLVTVCRNLSASALGPDVEVWQLVSRVQLAKIIPQNLWCSALNLLTVLLSDPANFEMLKRLSALDFDPNSHDALFRVVGKITAVI